MNLWNCMKTQIMLQICVCIFSFMDYKGKLTGTLTAIGN